MSTGTAGTTEAPLGETEVTILEDSILEAILMSFIVKKTMESAREINQ